MCLIGNREDNMIGLQSVVTTANVQPEVLHTVVEIHEVRRVDFVGMSLSFIKFIYF